MNETVINLVGRVLVAASLLLSHAALAQFQVTAPNGRLVTLYENGTWRYADAGDASSTAEYSDANALAILTLERKTQTGNNCTYEVSLVNNYPYEIRSLVFFYAAYRANGVIYDTVSSGSGFTLLKPGDKQDRDFVVRGLACQDIARVQVLGGDRCDMGDLDKYSSLKGQCLARVRVSESQLVRFDK